MALKPNLKIIEQKALDYADLCTDRTTAKVPIAAAYTAGYNSGYEQGKKDLLAAIVDMAEAGSLNDG